MVVAGYVRFGLQRQIIIGIGRMKWTKLDDSVGQPVPNQIGQGAGDRTDRVTGQAGEDHPVVREAAAHALDAESSA
jgi:hypothetical protein